MFTQETTELQGTAEGSFWKHIDFMRLVVLKHVPLMDAHRSTSEFMVHPLQGRLRPQIIISVIIFRGTHTFIQRK